MTFLEQLQGQKPARSRRPQRGGGGAGEPMLKRGFAIGCGLYWEHHQYHLGVNTLLQ